MTVPNISMQMLYIVRNTSLCMCADKENLFISQDLLWLVMISFSLVTFVV